MNRKFLLLLVAAALVVAGTGVFLWLQHDKRQAGKPVQLAGIVTDINNGCHVDGMCSVTLDRSKEIVTGCGLMANNKTCKSYDQSKLEQGQYLEATVVPGGRDGLYTLECATCAIREVKR
jgi:hypothetical protein